MSNLSRTNISNKAKFPIYYGWWIVIACAMTSLVAGGFVILGFTAFIEPISMEFGWSYAQISLAASLRGVETGIMAPILGFLVDRLGSRKILFAGMILLGAGLFMLSRINSLGMFYLSFALLCIGTSGTSPTVTFIAVAQWFRKRQSFALGVMTSGFALGSLLIPLVVMITDTFDWRTAALIMAFGTWIIGIPFALMVRRKPEYYPGVTDEQVNVVTSLPEQPATVMPEQEEMGLRQIVKSRTFWHLTLGLSLPYFSISAIITHIIPYLSSIGITRTSAGIVAMAIPLVSIIGRMGGGWLGDRINIKMVATAFITFDAIGLILLNYAANWIFLLPVFTLIFGIGYGGNVPLRFALLTKYFGQKNQGAILGLIMGMTALGNVAGPFLAGLIFDTFGSYQNAWILMALINFLAMVLLVKTPAMRNSGNLH